MGSHRKPKTKPTAFAAVVTAAIVVPAGTAAAAGYGALDSSKNNTHDLSAGLLATKANSAATSAARSAVRRVVAVPAPTRSASAAASTPTPKPSASNAPATSTPSPSAKASTSPAAAKVAKPSPSPSPSAKATTSAPSAPVAQKANPYQNVTLADLEPTGLYGSQQYITLTSAQWANAKTIVSVTEQRGMPLYAAVIATATALQESSLINLTYATNYDSRGLFQQRPSMGWGTVAQVTDPTYATNAFLTALAAYAPNYDNQALWMSAQAVQRSGLPTAYAQWEDQAAQIVQAIANGNA